MTLATQRFLGVYALPIIAAVLLSFLPFATFAKNDSTTAGTRVEIAVTDSGNVLVRGAKVTSVSGGVIHAGTTWNSTTLDWTVTTDSATKFYNSGNGNAVLSDIVVGDVISFAGSFESGSSLSVKATAVKDWKATATNATISGTVQSINTSSNTIVLSRHEKKNANLTVQLSSSTEIVLSGATTTLSSIIVGDQVKATGTLSADGNTLTATKLVVTHKTSLDDKKWNSLVKSWFSEKGKFFFNFNLKNK